jgi:phenylalanyl-tRNA synthetase beta chain
MSTQGVVVGRVLSVAPHPNGERIRLAQVDMGGAAPVQIVFGGNDNIRPGHLVPVAPPGSRVPIQPHRMRRERFRGAVSHGMLCSLVDLGWATSAPDEVTVLRDVSVGDGLDRLNGDRREAIVMGSADPTSVDWAHRIAKQVILTNPAGIQRVPAAAR